ncbi:VanZ family protein [Paenibacillus sp. CF384]|uniref:VanZ family protein n=1 Tax=Paenibacillus sp. CF384 TaxID=1884382 RepID=UPI00089BF496|nr:VanZ family protein [Paenibacillus sp. CF384]SDW06237.1 Glycopeptide antibiotics resistance protein [Paenibacillus sp. CF384]
MSVRVGIKKVLLYGVFTGYIILLIKILFLSRVSISELFSGQRSVVRSINLIPFHSINEFISGSTSHIQQFAMGNVVGNILIFIPLGVYLALFKTNKRIINNVLLILIVSVMVEIIQGLLGIGSADIDDIFLNGLGGWMGIVVYKSCLFLLRDEKKTITVVTVLSAIVGIPVIYYLLFMIKMRF